jgi:hypothetical protein
VGAGRERVVRNNEGTRRDKDKRNEKSVYMTTVI